MVSHAVGAGLLSMQKAPAIASQVTLILNTPKKCPQVIHVAISCQKGSVDHTAAMHVLSHWFPSHSAPLLGIPFVTSGSYNL
jgi:hypothetical protein